MRRVLWPEEVGWGGTGSEGKDVVAAEEGEEEEKEEGWETKAALS